MEKITIQTLVSTTMNQVWERWTVAEHIIQWNAATDEWHTPKAENDLRENGSFNYRMEAKDGSFGFDFKGTYQKVIEHQLIEYTLEDGRKVSISFQEKENQIEIIETFEAESENPVEMQRDGWQLILNNFKKYAEK